LSVWDINNLSVSERPVLRKILGPIQCKEGWRIRSNNELQKLIKGEDIVKYTVAQRIKWWGHLTRMEGIKLVKITTGTPKEYQPKDDQRTDGDMK